MSDILRYKHLFLGFSAVLVLASIIAIAVFGLKPGIDFTGGSLLEVEFSGDRPETSAIREALLSLPLGDILVQPIGERGMLLRFGYIDEELHQKILETLGVMAPDTNVSERRFDTIGPVIGREIFRSSLVALALAVIGIAAYITFAFRHVSHPVSSWKYGVVTLVALLHDVVIPTGAFAVLGYFQGVEVGALFMTALLTIMGFSVHDTIVVFDRIRENLRRTKGSEPYERVVEKSIRETLTRSITTSLTVLLVLVAIFSFGGETTRYFALALIVGIFFGTYSSIFLASPLLVVWHGAARRARGTNK